MTTGDQVSERVSDSTSRRQDAHHLVFTLQDGTTYNTYNGANVKAANATDSAAMVKSKALPNLTIDHSQPHPAPHENGFMQFLHGAESALSNSSNATKNDAAINAGKLVAGAELGLLAGVAIVSLPEVATAAVVLGATVGAYELATHIGGWTGNK